MDPRLLEVRRRLLLDYQFYAEHALKIRTKDASVIPLRFNVAQRHAHRVAEGMKRETGRVRCIILKARQQGLSTYVEGRLYWTISQRRNHFGLVLAHKDDSTTNLFGMTRRYHRECPKWLRPHTKYSSKRELYFDLLDSRITVATARGDAVGRGDTLQFVHASELAFWPETTAAEIFGGLAQAVPDLPGTELWIESTANGVTGLFYDLWKASEAGESEFRPIFIPWHWEPGYRAKVPKGGFELTPEEKELQKEFGLDLEQLWWRRKKIASTGLDLFHQEYPIRPSEAFLATGRPVFESHIIERLEAEATYAPKRFALEGEKWVESVGGDLEVWEEPKNGEVYYIGADVGAGVRGGDYSVAQVLDGRRRQVAMYRALVHPDYFGRVLNYLGYWYNGATICCECNNHGILTNHVLAKELMYPWVWTDTRHDQEVDIETRRLGFFTSAKTKPLVINRLRASLRDGEIEIRDPTTVSEMRAYVVRDSGKMEASEGHHDDCVIALALANYVHDGGWLPVVNKDEYYLEAI